MKNIDIPPFWLVVFIVAAWAIGQALAAPRILPVFFGGLGVVLVLSGFALMLWSVLTMVRAKTTPVPRRDPSAIVTWGPFEFSRNPIYLGDALILLGLIVWWQSWIALILVPIFIVFIQRRFIIDEENRLARQFGDDFLRYCGNTRRWI